VDASVLRIDKNVFINKLQGQSQVWSAI